MGKAVKRKEQRRIERALSSQSANDTPTSLTSQQTLIVQYHPLRHAISWADLSTASPIQRTLVQSAANDDVISTPEKPPKQRKKPGPKPKPLAPEVRQAQLWALYADLWDELDAELSPRERRALQRALARNSGSLDDLIEQDDTEETKEYRRVVRLLDDEEEDEDSEIDY